MTVSNDFINIRPVSKKKREITSLILIGLISLSIILIYTYIRNSPINPDNFPVINITTEEEIKKEDYIDCKFELKYKDKSKSVDLINGIIKIRGRYNADLPKKEYRIELSKSISLLGMRKDEDWILLAMYSDITNMQIKLSMDLYNTLTPSNPTAILPKSEYVVLYLNRELQGLYLLVEKNDRRLYGLDDAKNNIDSSLIFQSSYAHKNFYYYLNEEWEQDWPNEYEDIYIMDTIMNELITFIRDSDNITFFDKEIGIYSKFYKQNLIDFYVYNFFIHHDDFWDHNYFIVRNSNPNKFFLIPWDFDRCFGQWLRRHIAPNTNDEDLIKNYNFLFLRLLNNDDFKNECRIRWFELRETIWSEQNIIEQLSDLYNDIREVSEIDFDLWYHYLWSEDWKDKCNEAIYNLFEWIPERLEFCDSYFSIF